MKEMIRRFLRQKFGSVGVVVALAALSLLSGAQIAATGRGAALESGGFVALIVLAAASVSRDISSGALQMILARPIRRVDYLFGRYCGILLAYAVYVVSTLAFALALPRVLGRFFGTEGAPKLAAADLARGAAASLLSAALFAAVLLFFSTFLRGFGDVLAYFLLSLLLSAPEVLARPLRLPWLATLGNVARENILPRVSWEEVLSGENVFAPATGEFVLAVTAYLTLAAWIFSRREFTYGHD